MILNYYDEMNKIEEDIIKEYENVSNIIINEELTPDSNGDQVEVSLSVVSEDEIREINREYRGIDRVTDVLSFPQYDDASMIKHELDNLQYLRENEQIPVMLGDVVICYEVARKQSIEYGNTIKRELVYLFVHSMLHLLGYDHIEDSDRKIMRKREEEIMSEIGIER